MSTLEVYTATDHYHFQATSCPDWLDKLQAFKFATYFDYDARTTRREREDVQKRVDLA